MDTLRTAHTGLCVRDELAGVARRTIVTERAARDSAVAARIAVADTGVVGVLREIALITCRAGIAQIQDP